MWRSLYVDLRSLEFVREEHDGRAVYSAIVWGPDEMFVLNHLEGFWPESELLEIAMVVPGWWTAAAGI